MLKGTSPTHWRKAEGSENVRDTNFLSDVSLLYEENQIFCLEFTNWILKESKQGSLILLDFTSFCLISRDIVFLAQTNLVLMISSESKETIKTENSHLIEKRKKEATRS